MQKRKKKKMKYSEEDWDAFWEYVKTHEKIFDKVGDYLLAYINKIGSYHDISPLLDGTRDFTEEIVHVIKLVRAHDAQKKDEVK